MQALCARFGTALVWITHDLPVIAGLADDVAVMYAGRIVDKRGVDQVRAWRFTAIAGKIPSALNPSAGCHFQPRCPYAFARCSAKSPALVEVAPGHRSACHLNAR